MTGSQDDRPGYPLADFSRGLPREGPFGTSTVVCNDHRLDKDD